MNETIELLTKAREHYREHGGIRGTYKRDGHTCALGSLYSAAGVDPLGQPVGTAIDARLELHRRLPLGYFNVPKYNDSFKDPNERRAAILDLYDATIKDLENE